MNKWQQRKLTAMNLLALVLLVGAMWSALRFQPWTSVWLIMLSNFVSYDVKITLLRERVKWLESMAGLDEPAE